MPAMTRAARRARSAAVFFAVLGLLAGCTGARVPQSPSHADGFLQGCESARADAGLPTYFMHDPVRMATDPDYAAGWQHGYQFCLIEALRLNRMDDFD